MNQRESLLSLSSRLSSLESQQTRNNIIQKFDQYGMGFGESHRSTVGLLEVRPVKGHFKLIIQGQKDIPMTELLLKETKPNHWVVEGEFSAIVGRKGPLDSVVSSIVNELTRYDHEEDNVDYYQSSL